MIVVSDTSPIRGLIHLHRLDLLERLFNSVLIPPAVARELREPTRHIPAFDINSVAFLDVQSPTDRNHVDELLSELDEGEAEAIALAVEMKAESILMDEAAGREVARRFGLVLFGLVGILVRSKSLGLIPELRPLLKSLREEVDFFLSTSFATIFSVESARGRFRDHKVEQAANS